MALLQWIGKNAGELAVTIGLGELVHRLLANHGERIVVMGAEAAKRKLSNRDRQEFLDYIHMVLPRVDAENGRLLWEWYLDVRRSNNKHPGREDRWVNLLADKWLSLKGPDHPEGPNPYFAKLAGLPDDERLAVLDFLENDKISQFMARVRKETAEFFAPALRQFTMPKPNEPSTLRRELTDPSSGSATALAGWLEKIA